jgi:L-lactate dehydrogenase (cytochrome)
MGTLDVESATDDEKAELRLKVSAEEEDEGQRIKKEREAMEERGLGVIVNMRDFEVSLVDLRLETDCILIRRQKYAEPMLSKVALAYYASAGDDEISQSAQHRRRPI